MEYIDVIGFEGLYKISSTGEVVSTKRRGTKTPVLNPNLGKNGYLSVCLRNKDKTKKMTIHRLIAIHFIPNPQNLTVVDHINRNKTDNRVENLRWVSPSENCKNRTRAGCISIDRRAINGKLYEYYRVFYTPIHETKRISKRFKTREEAEQYLTGLIQEHPEFL